MAVRNARDPFHDAMSAKLEAAIRDALPLRLVTRRICVPHPPYGVYAIWQREILCTGVDANAAKAADMIMAIYRGQQGFKQIVDIEVRSFPHPKHQRVYSVFVFDH